MVVSLQTALGVLLHDTNIDKAIISSWKVVRYNAHGDVLEAEMPENNPQASFSSNSISSCSACSAGERAVIFSVVSSFGVSKATVSNAGVSVCSDSVRFSTALLSACTCFNSLI